MKGSRFSEEQIIGLLREHEAGHRGRTCGRFEVPPRKDIL